jgi:superfamily II DNA/RNA helicase
MAVPKFEDLIPALSTEALNAVESFGFHHTTPVQAATIPLFLSHKVILSSLLSSHEVL